MLNIGCCSHLSMSDEAFSKMPDTMRRGLFERIYFVDTPKYSYSLGARGEFWVLFRRPRNSQENGNIVDEWR